MDAQLGASSAAEAATSEMQQAREGLAAGDWSSGVAETLVDNSDQLGYGTPTSLVPRYVTEARRNRNTGILDSSEHGERDEEF